MENDGRYTIKSLQKAFDLIDCFSAEQPELTLTDLQQRLELDKTNIYRILVNLEQRGILQRNPLNGKFRLGIIMLHYAKICTANYDIREIALPHMQKLAEESGETVIMNIVQGYSGICVERINSVHPLKITADLGRKVPLLRGASGRILAAYLSEQDLETVYAREKADIACSFREIQEQMEQIRAERFAISFAELDQDTAGISCPVFDTRGVMVAGVSAIGPLFRYTEERVKSLIPEVKNCAVQISAAMGYLQ